MDVFVAKYGSAELIRAQFQEEMAMVETNQAAAKKVDDELRRRRRRDKERKNIVSDLKASYNFKLGQKMLRRAAQCPLRPVLETDEYMEMNGGSKTMRVMASCKTCGLFMRKRLTIAWEILPMDSDERIERKILEKVIYTNKRAEIEMQLAEEMIEQIINCEHENDTYNEEFAYCKKCYLQVNWPFDEEAYNKYIDDELVKYDAMV